MEGILQGETTTQPAHNNLHVLFVEDIWVDRGGNSDDNDDDDDDDNTNEVVGEMVEG